MATTSGILVSDTEVEKTVDIGRLCDVYENMYYDLKSYRHYLDHYEDIRDRFWPESGQVLTGASAGRKTGPDAKPYPGAFDSRNFYIDDLIKSDVELLVRSVWNGSLEAVPVSGADMARAKLTSLYLKYLLFAKTDDFRSELELAASTFLEKGIVAVGVFWENRLARELQDFTIDQFANILLTEEELQQISQQAEQGGPGLDPVYLQQTLQSNPSKQQELEDVLKTELRLKQKEAEDAVEELALQMVTAIPIDGESVNRPMIKTYTMGRDLIVPLNTADLQSSPVIFQRQNIPAHRLREYVLTEDWNSKLADRIIEKQLGEQANYHEPSERHQRNEGKNTFYDRDPWTIEIIRAYRRLSNKNGVPGIYETIFSTSFKEKGDVLYHGLRPDRLRNRYPFWPIKLENKSRLLFDSKGYVEILESQQNQLKIFLDSWLDNASLRISPPVEYQVSRGIPERGPGAAWPVFQRGEAGYGEIPDFDPATPELMQYVDNIARNQVGAFTTPEHQTENTGKKQGIVDKWESAWSQIIRMVWWQYQVHGNESEKFQVLGAASNIVREFEKGDPSEDYDLRFSFDVASQDPQSMESKLRVIVEMAQALDRNGKVNYDEALTWAVEAMIPTIANRILKPDEQMQQDQMDDVMDHLKNIWAGMDVDIPQQGVNAQLWMQVLQSWIQGSEVIPAVDVQKRLQEDEAFQARVQKLQQQLQFQMDQRVNATEFGPMGTRAGNLG